MDIYTPIVAFCLLFSSGNIQCDAGYADPVPTVEHCDAYFSIHLPQMVAKAGELAPNARIFIEHGCPAATVQDFPKLAGEIEVIAKKVSGQAAAARNKGI